MVTSSVVVVGLVLVLFSVLVPVGFLGTPLGLLAVASTPVDLKIIAGQEGTAAASRVVDLTIYARGTGETSYAQTPYTFHGYIFVRDGMLQVNARYVDPDGGVETGLAVCPGGGGWYYIIPTCVVTMHSSPPFVVQHAKIHFTATYNGVSVPVIVSTLGVDATAPVLVLSSIPQDYGGTGEKKTTAFDVGIQFYATPRVDIRFSYVSPVRGNAVESGYCRYDFAVSGGPDWGTLPCIIVAPGASYVTATESTIVETTGTATTVTGTRFTTTVTSTGFTTTATSNGVTTTATSPGYTTTMTNTGYTVTVTMNGVTVTSSMGTIETPSTYSVIARLVMTGAGLFLMVMGVGGKKLW